MPGKVRCDAIVDIVRTSQQLFVDLIEQAQATGELASSVDSAQLAYELAALCDAPNWTLHEPDGQADIDRARTAVRTRLDNARSA